MRFFGKQKENGIDTQGMDFSEKIKFLVSEARKTDPHFTIFGAKSHKYRFNPPVDGEKVSEFEKKYSLELPEAYVAFLTKVGNGGAGPQYGLYSLAELEANNDYLLQDDSLPVFIDSELTKQNWNEMIKRLESADDEEYEALMRAITRGMLVIGTQGCTFDTFLMCCGSERGRIGVIDWNMKADAPPFLENRIFEDWICGYFEKIIAGDVRHINAIMRIVNR